MHAAMQGRTDSVRLLLEADADKDATGTVRICRVDAAIYGFVCVCECERAYSMMLR